MPIYIFSRPVHSGKTSALMNWCDQQDYIAGLLMPDIHGSRKIYNIETKEIFDIECIGPTYNPGLLTTIGRFHFYTEAFEKANSILLHAMAQKPLWLVIDEVGKLEMEGKGFYGSLKIIAGNYNAKPGAGNLLITVRDSLCDEVISFFKFKTYRIIHHLEELK